MEELILTKESTENQIKAYFQKVLELKQSNEEFPINLDEVWMLVYARKDYALRELRKNFLEDEDFQLLQNEKVVDFNNIKNGIPYTAKLSVSCLEYFIARKVRPVFNVYRQVFHKVAEQKPMSQIDLIIQSAQMLKEQDMRITSVEDKVKEIEAKQTTRPNYYTIVGYGTLHNISVNLKQASSLGQKASKRCKDLGIETDTIPDPRFGKVKMYPESVLDEVFALPIN